MQYLDYFARLRQSRRLARIGEYFLKKIAYVFKHPIKTIFFLIKFYISLLLLIFLTVFLFGSLAQAQTIYDGLDNYPQSPSNTCMKTTDEPMSTWLNRQKSEEIAALMQTQNASTRYTPDRTGNAASIQDVNNGAYCYGNIGSDRFLRQANDGDSGWYDVGFVSVGGESNVFGTYELVDQCPNDAFPSHEFQKDVNGTPRCFNLFEIQLADTCGSDTPDLLGTSGSADLVCHTKEDGSACAMEKYEVNGQFAYAQAIEPETCYQSPEIPPYEVDDNLNDIDGTECQDLGGGVTACPADPIEECDAVTGVCRAGCGTFDIGGGNEFICLTEGSGNGDDEGEDDTNEVDLTETNQILNTIGLGQQQLISETQVTNSELVKQTQQLSELKEALSAPAETVDFTAPQGFTDAVEPIDYENRNFGTALENAKNQMQNTQLVQSVNTFFAVSFTGTCPTYRAQVNYLNMEIVIDQFCSSAMTNIWPIVHAIIILVFSVLAFRVAIL